MKPNFPQILLRIFFNPQSKGEGPVGLRDPQSAISISAAA